MMGWLYELSHRALIGVSMAAELTAIALILKRWSGTPVNRAVDEHDAVSWVEAMDLGVLSLAHPSCAELLCDVLSA
jgi:hypothetical protein